MGFNHGTAVKMVTEFEDFNLWLSAEENPVTDFWSVLKIKRSGADYSAPFLLSKVILFISKDASSTSFALCVVAIATYSCVGGWQEVGVCDYAINGF